MRRSAPELVFILGFGGCALGDGQPWGVADLRLDGAFVIPTDRVGERGRLLTANDYELELVQIFVTTRQLDLAMAPQGAALGFDPASPPEGYTLCHNGHCHASDGRLVSYEDVAIESGAAGGGFVTGAPTRRDPVELTSQPVAIPLGPCADACRLERGELRTVSLELESFGFTLIARDLRQGDAQRLSGPLNVGARLPFGTTLTRLVSAPVDRGEAIGLLVKARIVPPPTLFDDVDWSAMTTTSTVDLSGSRGLAQRIEGRFQEDRALEVEIERFDIEGGSP